MAVEKKYKFNKWDASRKLILSEPQNLEEKYDAVFLDGLKFYGNIECCRNCYGDCPPAINEYDTAMKSALQALKDALIAVVKADGYEFNMSEEFKERHSFLMKLKAQQFVCYDSGNNELKFG